MTLTHKPGTPSWVDLGTTDVAGAAAFYGALFGWALDELGPEAGGYGLLRKDGRQVAGIGPATDPSRGTSWAVYFATGDVAASAAKVEAEGGEVVLGPMQVMDQGSMAVFTDPQGAYFSAWQAAAHTGAELIGKPDSLSWVELSTPDRAAATEFYCAVFGLTAEDTDMNGVIYTVLSLEGRRVAGIFTPSASGMPPFWQVYFAVEDRDAYADRAIALGGSEMLRADYPGGKLGVLRDPQSGIFGITESG